MCTRVSNVFEPSKVSALYVLYICTRVSHVSEPSKEAAFLGEGSFAKTYKMRGTMDGQVCLSACLSACL